MSFYITEQSNANKDKDSVLWVARLEDWKRPGLFLKLAQDFPDQKFYHDSATT